MDICEGFIIINFIIIIRKWQFELNVSSNPKALLTNSRNNEIKNIMLLYNIYNKFLKYILLVMEL